MSKLENAPYVLGHSDFELKRLGRQARLVDPMTRRLFVEAGIGRGMRVLDVGSGAGDVAILLAELVGPTGEVLGADMSSKALATARARIAELGLGNVSFIEGDPSLMAFDRPFDAIAGRYVLMFIADPTAALAGLSRHLRPGGIAAFHEVDWDGSRSFPAVPLFDRCSGLCAETLRRMGANPHMGLRLQPMFQKAGLKSPAMRLEALAGNSEVAADAFRLIAELTITLLPDMERLGLVEVGEFSPDTLSEQMLEQASRTNSVAVGRSEVGIWSSI